jgi:UDP-N-acetylglucosamine transferase subunit ALG13
MKANGLSKGELRKGNGINISLVCTPGGHFEQMTNLSEFYDEYNHFWITIKNKQTESQLQNERAYYIKMAHFKKPWTYLSQMIPVVRIFRLEKPTHVLSTGSGRTAFVPFLWSKIIGAEFIYIDTFSRVHGHTKFGTFLLKTKNKIYTQWKDPENKDAVYIGPIFKKPASSESLPKSAYIFVTVGTREEPFTRLLKGVEELVRKGKIKEKVIVQGGHTRYSTELMEVFDFCAPEKIDELIRHAQYVITQESAGIGTQCLKHGTRFIVMPRDYIYKELPAQSDMKEDLHYELEKLGYTKVVNNTQELEEAIEKIVDLKIGFHFNNSLAISTLHKQMEKT